MEPSSPLLANDRHCLCAETLHSPCRWRHVCQAADRCAPARSGGSMIPRFQFLLPPSRFLHLFVATESFRHQKNSTSRSIQNRFSSHLSSNLFLSLYSSQDPKSGPLHHELDTKEEPIYLHLHPCCRCYESFASPLHSRCPRVPDPPLSHARSKKKKENALRFPGFRKLLLRSTFPSRTWFPSSPGLRDP